MSSPDPFRYERMAQQHVPEVAALHEVCFEGYYLTRLGLAFLRAMYGWYVENPDAIAQVALDGSGRAVGFVAGTTRAETYHVSLFREQGGALLAALAWRAVTSPVETVRLVWQRKDMARRAFSSMIGGGSQTSTPPTGQSDDGLHTASLVSIGVDPSQRRSGIGRRLSELFLQEAKERGCELVALSVREDNLAARRFYESLDWKGAGRSSFAYHGSHSITYEKSTRG
jgi:ribosomal protein S18 acetylase RimI-like enzyme